MRHAPRKFSPSLIVACVALFVALASTSVAAVSLARNSVLSRHIKDGTVKNVDLSANSIRSAKIADGSIAAADIAPGVIQPAAFARVDGTPTTPALQGNVAGFPPQTQGIAADDIVRGEGGGVSVGTYCFNLDFRPAATAIVSLDNADTLAADRNLVTSVAIGRGEDLGDCPASHNDARVRIVDGNTAAAQNGHFFIWFTK
jgi:hypothetical protein